MPEFNNLNELYAYLEKGKNSPKKAALKKTADKLADVEKQIAEHVIYGAGEPKVYERGSGTDVNGGYPQNMVAKEITKGRNPETYGSYKIGYDYSKEQHHSTWGSEKYGIRPGGYFCEDIDSSPKSYAVPMIIITGGASNGNSRMPEGFYSKPRDYVTKTYEDITKYHMDTNYFITYMKDLGINVTKK